MPMQKFELEAENEKLKKRIERLNQQLTNARTAWRECYTENANLKSEIERLKQRLGSRKPSNPFIVWS
jgi:regulator of replication initiation timing